MSCRVLLLPACLIVVLGVFGCQKKAGFVGTWKTSAAETQGGSESTMTFNADQTMSFVAFNGPNQTAYKLSGMGTWKSSEKELTVTPASMNLEGVTPITKAKLTPYLQAQVNVAQTGPVEWKGEDEFVCTKNGIAQDFKRVK
jgi:hypothetical protein